MLLQTSALYFIIVVKTLCDVLSYNQIFTFINKPPVVVLDPPQIETTTIKFISKLKGLKINYVMALNYLLIVNLAIAIKNEYPAKNVGLLDADVFGPTVPLMMNLNDTPLLNDKNLMEPLNNYGIKCMSMGFLMSEGVPLVWRGLMVMQALEKLMRQVAWGDVDYLIVDTPPGTGDTHLSLAQNLPITGVLLVTTPHCAAVEVTKRGAVMYEQLKVPVIGIVENMSFVKCPACLNNVQLFNDSLQEFTDSTGLQLVARMPLEKEVSMISNNGAPVVISKPQSICSVQYNKLASVVTKFCDNNNK